jgi:ribosomal RNA-processing protein 1
VVRTLRAAAVDWALTAYSPTDIKVPLGLVYHLADVWLEELDKVQKSSLPEEAPAPLTTIVAPLLAFSAQTTSKIAFKRMRTAAWEPLLESLSPTDADSDEEEEEERPRKRSRIDEEGTWPGVTGNSCLDDPSKGRLDREVLCKGVRRKIFEVASDPTTRDSNRRQLYKLWKEEGALDSDDE